MIEQPLADLDAWVAYFSAADLPVLRHTVEELERHRADAENVNGRVLAGIILHDPLMVLRVLAYIQSHRMKRQLTDITTIERAIIMIGVNPFFRDFQNLPLIEEQLHAHPKALLGLLRVINRSRRAAHWAREWAIIRHDLNVDEITVATLVNDVAEILMWLFAPTLAIKVRDAQQEQPHRRSVTIQEEIYGVPLHEVKRALAHAWNLPSLLTMLMDGEFEKNPRVRSVKLAVDLARHSAHGWDDAALPDDIKGIGELLQLDQSSTIRTLGLDEEAAELLKKTLEAAAEADDETSV